MRTLLAALVMTFALGFSTAAAFYAIGGSLALRGPFVLAREWPAIYGLVVLVAFGVGLVFGLLARSRSRRWLAVVVMGGWLGEYVVLASGLLADELFFLNYFLNAGIYWLLATAGPIQPVAAWLGGLLGQRLRRQWSLARIGG